MNYADILAKNIFCRENNKYEGPEEKTHFLISRCCKELVHQCRMKEVETMLKWDQKSSKNPDLKKFVDPRAFHSGLGESIKVFEQRSAEIR